MAKVEIKRRRARREPFLTILSARQYARRNNLTIVTWVAHRRGVRLDVVTRTGKPRTLRVVARDDAA